jgi:hypothetical protein
VFLAEHVGEQGAVRRQLTDARGILVENGLLVVFVLFDHDHDMIVNRKTRRPSRRASVPGPQHSHQCRHPRPGSLAHDVPSVVADLPLRSANVSGQSAAGALGGQPSYTL